MNKAGVPMSSVADVARARKSLLSGLPPGLTDRGTWLPVVVFLVLVLIFSLASPAFFTWRNLSATTGEAATLLIASLGASFVILMGGIDLDLETIQLGEAVVDEFVSSHVMFLFCKEGSGRV